MPLRIEIFHGFIFVCDDESVESEQVMAISQKNYQSGSERTEGAKDMVCMGRREYVVECNWKFLMENTCETYHTSVVHKHAGSQKATPMGPHCESGTVCRSVKPIGRAPTWGLQRRSSAPSHFRETHRILEPLSVASIQCDMGLHVVDAIKPTESFADAYFQGFALKSTVERPRFEIVYEAYRKRCTGVSEDNAISLNQRAKIETSQAGAVLSARVRNAQFQQLGRIALSRCEAVGCVT